MFRKKPNKWITAAVIFSWAGAFLETESYFSVYFLLALLDIAACFADRREFGNERGGEGTLSGWQNGLILVLSVLFSVAVTAANYSLFTKTEDWNGAFSPLLMIYSGVVTLLGVCAAWEGLHYLALKTVHISGKALSDPRRTFLLCFGASLIVNSAVLFICYYPGIITRDSVQQITQIFSGQFTNHHPYFHTQMISLFLKLGVSLFGDISSGAALYSMTQIVIMALCFGYAAATVAEMGMPRWAVLAGSAYFVLMPFHIWFSITMWKDILFSGFVLVFVTALFRHLDRIGSHGKRDTVLAAVSCFGVCIMRGNGWPAIAAATLIFALLFFRREKGFTLLLLAMIAVSFVMNHSVLDALGVKPTESVESLSVPLQQVARAVVDHEDIAPDEIELIEKVIGIDYIREHYRAGHADSIKGYITDYTIDYFNEHIEEYKALYLRMLREYPLSFIRSWIDQTKGYWNGGYEYWRWSEVSVDTHGIEQHCRSGLIKSLFYWYSRGFSAFPLLQPLLSIGLNTWLVCSAAMLALIRKNREAFFITLPVLAILGTLLVATPVYAEFRYAYPMFCAMPVLLTAVFYEKRV